MQRHAGRAHHEQLGEHDGLARHVVLHIVLLRALAAEGDVQRRQRARAQEARQLGRIDVVLVTRAAAEEQRRRAQRGACCATAAG